MTKLKLFKTNNDVLQYIRTELLCTLRDDLAEMGANKEPAKERNEMKRRIHDIEAVESDLSQAFDILLEWKADVDALFDGEGHLQEWWPDMKITYDKANALLKKGWTA